MSRREDYNFTHSDRGGMKNEGHFQRRRMEFLLKFWTWIST